MKTFEIKKVEEPNNVCLILSNSYINPLEELESIESDLQNNFTGKVIFDLLLSNGNSSNRFMEAIFDGNKFDYSSFKIITDVDVTIKKISASYYRNNENLMQSTIVSDAFKFLLRNGKIL
ncbi:hypothetical protein J2S00_003952 [Caldalkalibacillus uzonensis]|uniref:RnlB antitoxin of RnlAB toxin-antitoxin system n=1 Tax=Caldalkalibacillus uzonensis TaxID=353224 RepID=A0ABU0CY73_9BACI|nr:type II toxin-antitoxin system RnlB family antitoxin [Caldalkalibacillus uzonensis]MDQ0341108.1 hypothetical protein [Caldalkalibacillus uzonensis]